MSTIDLEPGLGQSDYEQFPDDGLRHELVGGVHVVSPAPFARHQVAVVAITTALVSQVDEAGIGRVLVAPIDVRLSASDVVQPDVLVVLSGSRARISARGVEGPPDLVIEVLSRSTRRLDIGLKRERYEACGVGEYWLVDPDRQTVWQHVRDGAAPGAGFATPVAHRERVCFAMAGVRVGVTLDLAPIWARVAAIPGE